MKRFISVLLIFALLFTTGIASLSAYGTDETVQQKNDTAANITASRFETILNNNYAYADDFSSVSAILNSSIISLLPHAEDGKMENVLIIDFMKNMYGIDPSVLCDNDDEVLNAQEMTDIIPTGFIKYNHTVDRIHINDDGTYSVYSTATGLDGEVEVTLDAISRFVPSSSSTFGYILVSCELLLPEESSAEI